MSQFYEPDILRRLQDTELEILKDLVCVCEKYHLEYFGASGTGIGAARHGGFIPWDDDLDIAMPRRDMEKALRIIEKEYPDKYEIINADRYPAFPLMTTHLCKKGTRFRSDALKGVDCPFGIFIDIFPYDNLADGGIAYAWQVWTAWFWSKLLILRSISHPTLSLTGWKKAMVQGICSLANRGMKLLHVSPEWLYRKAAGRCRKYNRKNTRRMGFPCDTDPNWNTVEKAKVYPLVKYKFEDMEINLPNNLDDILRKMYGDYMTLPPKEKRKTHYPYVLDFGDGINVADKKSSKK